MLRIHDDEIIVDNFAGGGGASVGIAWALGRDPDIAINHNPEAIAMHKANHPNTEHYVSDVFDVNPREACRGRKVGLAWFSPDCTFFSKARGTKPFREKHPARRRRGLAGVVLRWAEQVRPRVIAMENVEEFQDWGPLVYDKRRKGYVPDEFKRGFNFRRWKQRLVNLGYHVDMREMRACDFGAPTTRKRLFILACLDGPPEWPEASHGDAPGLKPFRTAAECIDWSIPAPSIFMTRKEVKEWKKLTGKNVRRPLRPDTMRRIAAGVKRYVLDDPQPFVVAYHAAKRDGDHRGRPVTEPLPTQDTANRFALVAPVLIQTSWGERKGQRPRYLNIHEPLGTVMADGIKHSVAEVKLERADKVTAFLVKHFGGEHPNGTPKSGAGSDARDPLGTVTSRDHNYLVTTHLVNLKGSMDDRQSSSQPVTEPVPTITANGNHIAEVRAFLVKFYGTDQDPRLDEPMHTLTTKHRMALVTVMIDGEEYAIVDICMRMLEPEELFRAQGFPDGYIIDPIVETKVKRGRRTVKIKKPLTKTAQVHMCGNAVSPYNAEAVLIPNFRRGRRRALAPETQTRLRLRVAG